MHHDVSGSGDPLLPPRFARLAAALRLHLISRIGTAITAGILLSLVHWARSAPELAIEAPTLSEAVRIALRRKGLEAEPSSLHWADESAPRLLDYIFGANAVVLARVPGQPMDVYSFIARLSPEGTLLAVRRIRNLTGTSAVSESDLVGSGPHIAWLVRDGGDVAVEYADLRGAPQPVEHWSWLMRLQQALTNYQQTARWAGIGRRSMRILETADDIVAKVTNDELVADARAFEVHWPHLAPRPTENAGMVDANDHATARPGNLLTWSVDRLRASPWVGSARMQWLKAVVYDAYDRYMRLRSQVVADDREVVAEELEGVLAAGAEPVPKVADIGWPPAPARPLLHPPLPKEGQWVQAHPDVVTLRNVDAPYPFVFTFLRTDVERAYSQISVVLWDPRQVALHMSGGTQEPKTATGEIGSGIIPRDPETIGRVVGAFNGAFQAVHGDFGMMENDRVILPPKPYGATVAALRDDTEIFGTWPQALDIPDDILSFRQNMTPVVLDGVINPYKRTWWGGVPDGWSEETRTVRSGLCLTRENFVAYFYGNHADPTQLGRAMLAVRCTYGIHLDMNAGHTGFEFYRVAKTTKPLWSKPVQEWWEATGEVMGMPGYQFMTRLMVPQMPLMNFPRYLFRVSRDFFYLTLRTLLPPEPVTPLVSGFRDDGVWHMDDIPQHGWPPAEARTTLHLDAKAPDAVARIVEIDPKMVRATEQSSDRVIATLQHPKSAGTRALWLENRRFQIGEAVPPSATAITYGDRREAVASARLAAAILPAGMLVLVTIEGVADDRQATSELERVVAHLNGRMPMFFEWDPSFSVGLPNLAKERARTTTIVPIYLVRIDAPSATRGFVETPVLPPTEWALLQRRRTVYNGRHGQHISPPRLIPASAPAAP